MKVPEYISKAIDDKTNESDAALLEVLHDEAYKLAKEQGYNPEQHPVVQALAKKAVRAAKLEALRSSYFSTDTDPKLQINPTRPGEKNRTKPSSNIEPSPEDETKKLEAIAEKAEALQAMPREAAYTIDERGNVLSTSDIEALINDR